MGAKAKVRFAANHLTLESEMDRDLKAELKFTFCKAKFIINQFDFYTVLLQYTIIYELTYSSSVYGNSILTLAEEERCWK